MNPRFTFVLQLKSVMKSWILGIGLFVLGVAAGYFINQQIEKQKPKVEISKPTGAKMSEVRNTKGYRFVSPLLECDEFSPSEYKNHSSLKAKIAGCIRDATLEGNLIRASVYYRDLNNGPWVGVNENDVFSPASLLKVPILMVAYKFGEINPDFLGRKVKALRVNDMNPNILDDYVVPGNSYFIEDLIERMIIMSDNDAKLTVVNELGESPLFNDLWYELGLEQELLSKEENFLSPRRFSTFFRILYNSTYLSRSNSENALEILSRTRFQKGIRSGVPESVMVASKFGERGFASSMQKQLHECAIVYDGGSPYLLCVMTEGTDFDTQAAVIAQISELVFHNR